MRKITFCFAALALSFQMNAQDAELASEVPVLPNLETEIVLPGNVLNEGTLYSNGPYFNVEGGGAGGADLSLLESATLGMNTLGAGAQNSAGNRIADDVTFDSDVEIDRLVFYSYQTGSTTASTMTGVNVRIWEGDLAGGSATLVWGDDVTNIMSDTSWSGAYRASETNPQDTTRPIMLVEAEVSILLPAGTYWFDWSFDGSLGSGPWQPAVAILGEATTGNAMQFLPASGWGAWEDTGTFTQQGAPFEVDGSVTQSVGDNVFSGFTYYPNPSSHVINISSLSNIELLSVYNMMGQELLKVSVNGLSHQLDISGLATGMYIMKAQVDGAEKAFNIVKR